MGEPQDNLADGSPLISAAKLGKLRLVRLLVEGGAQVNGRNGRGETPLLAVCKGLRGKPTGGTTVRLIRYLLQNQADPNSRDEVGRTALMYSCMERGGVGVAAPLLEAGADPSVEDNAGASALVYAINAQDQDTLQMLLDACRAKGRHVIIIATDLSPGGGSVTRRYLNVPPSPDTSPVACMSPSDIELKPRSPTSQTDGGHFFNFRGSWKRGCRAPTPLESEADAPQRNRLHSKPWLTISHKANPGGACGEGLGHRGMAEDGGEEQDGVGKRYHDNSNQATNQRGLSLISGQLDSSTTEITELNHGGALRRTSVEQPTPPSLRLYSRRNTVPSVMVPPLLQLPSPSLNLLTSDPHLYCLPNKTASRRTMLALSPSPRSSSALSLLPPSGYRVYDQCRQGKPGDKLNVQPQARGSTLPPLALNTPLRSPSGDPSPSRPAGRTQAQRPEAPRSRWAPCCHGAPPE